MDGDRNIADDAIQAPLERSLRLWTAVSTTDFATQSTAVGQRRRRSRPRPFHAGHLLSLVLAVIAAVAVLAALQGQSATRSVPIAARSVAAGAELSAADFRIVTMHANDASMIPGLLTPQEVVGRTSTVPIVAGDPITQAETSSSPPAGSGLGEMSLAVPLTDADGGNIVTGDRVDVIVAGLQTAAYVAQDVLVLSASSSSPASLLVAPGGNYFLTLAVSKETALRIATALASSGNNTVQVVRSDGEKPTQDGAFWMKDAPGAGLSGAGTS
jgi:Flp pilus assembly protein CpaB